MKFQIMPRRIMSNTHIYICKTPLDRFQPMANRRLFVTNQKARSHCFKLLGRNVSRASRTSVFTTSCILSVSVAVVKCTLTCLFLGVMRSENTALVNSCEASLLIASTTFISGKHTISAVRLSFCSNKSHLLRHRRIGHFLN